MPNHAITEVTTQQEWIPANPLINKVIILPSYNSIFRFHFIVLGPVVSAGMESRLTAISNETADGVTTLFSSATWFFRTCRTKFSSSLNSNVEFSVRLTAVFDSFSIPRSAWAKSEVLMLFIAFDLCMYKINARLLRFFGNILLNSCSENVYCCGPSCAFTINRKMTGRYLCQM